MGAVRVGAEAELPPGRMAEVSAGGFSYLLCNVDGVIYAIEGECPHRGAPLAFGALHGHYVVCPWHAWEFDCRTGQGPCGSVQTFSVAVQNGEIYLDARTA